MTPRVSFRSLPVLTNRRPTTLKASEPVLPRANPREMPRGTIDRRIFLAFALGATASWAVGKTFNAAPELQAPSLDQFFSNLQKMPVKPRVMIAYPEWDEFPGPGQALGDEPSKAVLRNRLANGVDPVRAQAISRTLDLITRCENAAVPFEIRRHTIKPITLSASILYKGADWDVLLFTMPHSNDAQRQQMLEVKRLLESSRRQRPSPSGQTTNVFNPIEIFLVDSHVQSMGN